MIVNNEENRLIHIVGMLMSRAGLDSNRDVYWDPFSDRMVQRIMGEVNLAIKTSRTLSELDRRLGRRTFRPFDVEYLGRKAALLVEEIRKAGISPTEIPVMSFFEPKHFK